MAELAELLANGKRQPTVKLRSHTRFPRHSTRESVLPLWLQPDFSIGFGGYAWRGSALADAAVGLRTVI
ncbi:MAG: hypothetical protein EAZ40_08645 [Rhodobacterales bacterium]|nr:MAG: hypothetical protein EAZ40_08645 [Rhodobacterales bacterium]